MKILVLSDSHSGLNFMRYCINAVKPAHIIHLGDFYEDGEVMQEEFPHIRFHQVSGNCDRHRREPWIAPFLCYDIGGVRTYMCHGHNHAVKSSGDVLLASAARGCDAQLALYGHTHEAVCYQSEDLWIMNPGTCRSYSGSVGIVEIRDKKITSCRILRQEDIDSLA